MERGGGIIEEGKETSSVPRDVIDCQGRERRDISLHLSSLCEKPKASNSQWTTSPGGPDADAVGGMFMAAEANFGGLAEEGRRMAQQSGLKDNLGEKLLKVAWETFFLLPRLGYGPFAMAQRNFS